MKLVHRCFARRGVAERFVRFFLGVFVFVQAFQEAFANHFSPATGRLGVIGAGSVDLGGIRFILIRRIGESVNADEQCDQCNK